MNPTKTILIICIVSFVVLFSIHAQSPVVTPNPSGTLSNSQLAADEAKHPRIRHALHALENAKLELQAANHDFGGHRIAAIQACDNAIQQLKIALQYAQ